MASEIYQQQPIEIVAYWNFNMYVECLHIEKTTINNYSLVISILSAMFGISNHVYGDENAFQKTKYGCQLFDKILLDMSNNRTKSITDEQQLIARLFNLLNDSTM
jgi:F0F1-type ATP synthase membrane subunit a